MSPELLAGAVPGDESGPRFAEAWHAEAFAVVVALTEAGTISPAEWTDTLAQAIADAQQEGDPDLGDTYYHHWLTALERLCHERALVARPAVDARAEEWRQAYLRTPHGQPVLLVGTPLEQD